MREVFEHLVRPRSRHEEILVEVGRLHEAARAVRQARGAEAERLHADGAGNRHHGAPSHRAPAGGSLPSRRPAWRSAAKRMGNSLVTVGRRLERLGGAAD